MIIRKIMCIFNRLPLDRMGSLYRISSCSSRNKKDFPNFISVTEDDYDIFYSNLARSEYARAFFSGLTCSNLLVSTGCPPSSNINLSGKCLDISVDRCKLKTKYKYFTHKNEHDLKIENVNNMLHKHTINKNGKNNLKIAIISPSHSENIFNFFAHSFKKIWKLKNNRNGPNSSYNLSRFKKELTRIKPDIIVFVDQPSLNFSIIQGF